MATLLLRLAGPLQAWGSSSKFNTRTTDREPTKSGVVGMIAAAMGRTRSDPITDLNDLRYGVRIDQAGKIIKDFHTVHHPTNSKLKFISDRFYLSDALFLVGLEGEISKLNEVADALKKPYFPIYLGRRSCPPSGQIVLGIREDHLVDALKNEAWLASAWYKRICPSELYLEIVHDADPQETSVLVRDSPVSFDQRYREYAFRGVNHDIRGKHIDNPDSRSKREVATDHDVFSELRKEIV